VADRKRPSASKSARRHQARTRVAQQAKGKKPVGKTSTKKASAKRSAKPTAKKSAKKAPARTGASRARKASVLLGATPVALVGSPPKVGSPAPRFTLTDSDLREVDNAALRGRRVILNIFPSIDTSTCAKSTRRFNEIAAGLTDTEVWCVSADLPFAQKRFCGAEGIERVKTASTFRSDFGKAFGLTMAEGVLRGVLARAVVVLDAKGRVVHSQLVPQIGDEPDYDAAVAALG
jgi:thiol peroxidase